MKIKIIDLLIKIANNEKVPKKIRYFGEIYEYSEEMKFYYQNGFSMYRDFFTEGNCLNDEVEIIEEEKEIEKIRMNGNCFFSESIEAWINKEKSSAYCEFLSNKINELVDEINKLKKEKK